MHGEGGGGRGGEVVNLSLGSKTVSEFLVQSQKRPESFRCKLLSLMFGENSSNIGTLFPLFSEFEGIGISPLHSVAQIYAYKI